MRKEPHDETDRSTHRYFELCDLGGGTAAGCHSSASTCDATRSSDGSGAGYRANGATASSKFPSCPSKFDDDPADEHNWAANTNYNQGRGRGNAEHTSDPDDSHHTADTSGTGGSRQHPSGDSSTDADSGQWTLCAGNRNDAASRACRNDVAKRSGHESERASGFRDNAFRFPRRTCNSGEQSTTKRSTESDCTLSGGHRDQRRLLTAVTDALRVTSFERGFQLDPRFCSLVR